MSRTKRIYNSKHWKWHTEQEILAKRLPEARWMLLQDDTGGLYGWTFVYHPYRWMCMGCCRRCGEHRLREKRTRRRKLKYEAWLVLKHWKDEIDERDILQEEN